MDEASREFPGSEIVGLLPNDHELWILLAGATIEHTTRGKGDILRVEMRGTYTPLIHIRFPAGQAQIPLDTFANGRFRVSLRSPVIGRILSSRDEIRKSEQEHSCRAEILRKQRTEQRKAERERARVAAEAEFARRERLREEQERLRLEKWRRYLEALPDRHKERIEQLGLEYRGIRTASRTRSHRTTHCWSCTRDLDNAVDVECVKCGWILCVCGACGCGYSREEAMV